MANRPSRVAISIPTISAVSGKYEGRYPHGDKPFPGAVPVKLVTRGLPVFASSGTASLATDSDYSQPWQPSSGTATLTIDISTIVGAIVADGSGRKPFLLNITDPSVDYWGSTTFTDATIKLNSAAGGAGSAPSSGYTTAKTMSGNTAGSRAFLIDVASQNWVQVSCTGAGIPFINIDGFDCSNSALSDFSAIQAGHVFAGDSISRFGMGLDPQGLPGSPASLGDQVKAILGTAYTPPVQNAGMPGWDTTTGTFGWRKSFGATTYLEELLKICPLLYVHYPLLTNDANASISQATAVANMEAARTVIRAYNKIMVLPTLPYSTNTNIEADRSNVAAAIAQMLSTYPDVIAGEDRYAYGVANPTQMSDTIHPDGSGYAGLRALAASRMAVFGGGA